MITSRAEKEARVIELYNQGKTIRDIAREVHMSFGSISEIIKKANGEDKKRDPISRYPSFRIIFTG
jgi:transposase